MYLHVQQTTSVLHIYSLSAAVQGGYICMCNIPQHTATHRNTPQHTAAHRDICICILHWCVAEPLARHSGRGWLYMYMQHTATHRSTLQHAATYVYAQLTRLFQSYSLGGAEEGGYICTCNILQHTAANCNTLLRMYMQHNTLLRMYIHMHPLPLIAPPR